MPKFIIKWNVGYGDDYKVVEANDEEEANTLAYDKWRLEVEDAADYEAIEYNADNCENYGLEYEEQK